MDLSRLVVVGGGSFRVVEVKEEEVAELVREGLLGRRRLSPSSATSLSSSSSSPFVFSTRVSISDMMMMLQCFFQTDYGQGKQERAFKVKKYALHLYNRQGVESVVAVRRMTLILS